MYITVCCSLIYMILFAAFLNSGCSTEPASSPANISKLGTAATDATSSSKPTKSASSQTIVLTSPSHILLLLLVPLLALHWK